MQAGRAETTKTMDVRVIAATNRDLEQSVMEGVFREDLFYRLSVIPIYLPPLRERREDIPMLAMHFLQRLCDGMKRQVTGISSTALKRILQHSWPGNIRELENAIEYALHLTDDGASVDPAALPPRVLGESGTGAGGADSNGLGLVSIEAYTKHAIQALQSHLKEEEIADLLGINRKTLWEKRKRWDLPRPTVPKG